MTENLNDGTAVPEGQVGTPTPASSPEPQKPFDGDVSTLFTKFNETLEGRFSALEKTFTEKLGRVQGTVDHQTSEFRKWMGEVEKLEKQGLSREEAVAQLEDDQRYEQRWQGIENQMKEFASILSGLGKTGGTGQMLTEVMSEYKLDPQDTYVASQLQGKQFDSRTAAEAWAGKVLRDKVLSNQPRQSQEASSPSNRGGGIRNRSAILEELGELQSNPTKENDAQRKALLKELQEAKT